MVADEGTIMKAFPTPTFSINNEARVTAVGGEGGMDLRDYFAAKAMQGQLSIRENVTALAREQIKLEDVCIASYEVADAMMKARQP
jgi:hypothetical protein